VKSSNFKHIILVMGVLLCCCSAVNAQNDTIYQEHLQRYHTFWNKLIPRHYKLQFAGSMGLFSFGPGWEYGKHHQWETDIFFGFLPKYDSKDNKVTFTLKENYIPWNKRINKRFGIDPLTVSLYFNSILSGKYWTNEPNKYPGGYYGFSTHIRINLAVGQRFTYYIPETQRRHNKSLSFFYELGTTDFYVVSAFNNHYLKLKDIVHLSLGIKAEVF
jgi:hypothetical protein